MKSGQQFLFEAQSLAQLQLNDLFEVSSPLISSSSKQCKKHEPTAMTPSSSSIISCAFESSRLQSSSVRMEISSNAMSDNLVCPETASIMIYFNEL